MAAWLLTPELQPGVFADRLACLALRELPAKEVLKVAVAETAAACIPTMLESWWRAEPVPHSPLLTPSSLCFFLELCRLFWCGGYWALLPALWWVCGCAGRGLALVGAPGWLRECSAAQG